jgi:pilus assembly protein Flp/PilA
MGWSWGLGIARPVHLVKTRGPKTVTPIIRFAKDNSGATAIEHGLIATLIGVAITVGAGALGTKLNSVFKGISTKLIAP